MQSTWVVLSKVGPPPLGAPILARAGQWASLVAPTAAQVVLLQAPSGYGKSTLLTEFRSRLLDQSDAAAPWLSLDETFASTGAFFGYLALALRREQVALPMAEDISDDALFALAPEAALGLVESALDRAPLAVALFLDDLHALGPWAHSDSFTRFLVRLPRNVRVFATTRGEVPRPLLQLRASGRLEAILAQDLRLRRAEIAELLGTVEPALLDEVDRLTEGWPVAVQLYRLARSSGSSLSVGAITGSVCAAALVTLDDRAREALVVATLFDRVRPELLDEILETSLPQELLSRIAHDTSLVSDVGSGWYRLHALLVDHLRGSVDVMDPRRRAILHRRGAHWFLGRGLLREAFQHAQRVGEVDFVAEIAERAGGWRLVIGGGRNALDELMKAMPGDPTRFPVLMLARVYSLAQEGLIVDARAMFEALREATHGFTRGAGGQWDPALAADVGIMEVILRIYEDRPLAPESVFALERQFSENSSIGPGVASVIANLICYAYFDLGDYERCLRYGEYALGRDHAVGSAYAEVYLFLYMGLAHFRLGDVAAARDRYARAFELARARFGPDSNQSAIATMLLAQVALESGEEVESIESLATAFSASLSRDGWFDVYFSGLETRVRLAVLSGDLDDAYAAIAQAERAGAIRGLPRLEALARLLRVELKARTGDVDEAADSLAFAANTVGLVDDQAPGPRHRRLWEALVAVSARIDLEAGRVKQAASRVDRALALLGHSPREGLRLRLLRSLALLASGATAPASREARDALREAGPRFDGTIAWELANWLPALLGSPDSPSDCASRNLRELAARYAAALVRPTSGGSENGLSPREKEILSWIAAGRSNKDVARRLGISESTVKTHRERIYRKLGIRSRADAVDIARQLGLLLPGGDS